MENHVGIAGIGIYLPKGKITAKDISDATKGVWSEKAVVEKLGIKEKTIPQEGDGTQEMGAKAALNALEDSGMDAKEIDVVLCMGEEWKEYPLTTSALYIISRIQAVNAWGIDVQNRCCTCVSAIKIAKDMLMSDDSINTIMVVGGYRNGDLVDYTDKELSMMFDLGAGAGAIILKKNLGKNLFLGSHIISDSSLARSAGVLVGGIENPTTLENFYEYNKLRVLEPEKMKDRLKEVSTDNWLMCIKQAFLKSGLPQKIDYLDILHFKRSAHIGFINLLGLKEEQTIYLENYGHIGQVDQILSLYLGLKEGKVKDGSVVTMLAAGIGYVWAANVIKWGSV